MQCDHKGTHRYESKGEEYTGTDGVKRKVIYVKCSHCRRTISARSEIVMDWSTTDLPIIP